MAKDRSSRAYAWSLLDQSLANFEVFFGQADDLVLSEVRDDGPGRHGSAMTSERKTRRTIRV
jgi:hypothetical protein